MKTETMPTTKLHLHKSKNLVIGNTTYRTPPEELVFPERHAFAEEVAKHLLDKGIRTPDARAVRTAMMDTARAVGDKSGFQQFHVEQPGTLRLVVVLRIIERVPQEAHSNARAIKQGDKYDGPFRHTIDYIGANVKVFFPGSPAEYVIPQDIKEYLDDVHRMVQEAMTAEIAFRESAEGKYHLARRKFEQAGFQNLAAGEKDIIEDLIDAAVNAAVERMEKKINE